MSKLTIFIGLLLTGIGVAAYVVTDFASITALIPAFIGIVMVLLGVIAVAKPKLNKHLMHGALLVALVGIAGSAMNAFKIFEVLGGAEVERPLAIYASAATFALLVIFLIAGIVSFIKARVLKKA